MKTAPYESQRSPEPRLLDTNDVAERLCLGRTTVVNLMKTGVLRTIRIGRSVRVSSADLADYIRILRGEADTRSALEDAR